MSQPTWSKKTLTSVKNNRQGTVRVYVVEDRIFLTTGYDEDGQSLLSPTVEMTANVAGDLAHALEEAIQHLREAT